MKIETLKILNFKSPPTLTRLGTWLAHAFASGIRQPRHRKSPLTALPFSFSSIFRNQLLADRYLKLFRRLQQRRQYIQTFCPINTICCASKKIHFCGQMDFRPFFQTVSDWKGRRNLKLQKPPYVKTLDRSCVFGMLHWNLLHAGTYNKHLWVPRKLMLLYIYKKVFHFKIFY